MTDLGSYLTDDQKELIELLNEKGVEYVMIGAVSVAYHGYPRDSQDIDFYFNPDEENTKKLFNVLDDFFHGGFEPDTTYEDIKGGATISFGRGTQTTEFLSDIDGVNFPDVYDNKETHETSEGLKLPLIDYEHLKKNKMSTGRKKDEADVEELEKIHQPDPAQNDDLDQTT